MAAFMRVGARAPRSYHSHYNPLVDLSSDDLYKNYRFTADGICQVTGLIEEDLDEIHNSRGRPILPQTETDVSMPSSQPVKPAVSPGKSIIILEVSESGLASFDPPPV